MTRPSSERLLSEAAELAYHFHWHLEAILDLEHADRRRFLAEARELDGTREIGAEWTTSA